MARIPSLSRHPNPRNFDRLARQFTDLYRDDQLEDIFVREIENSDILQKFRCDELIEDNWHRDPDIEISNVWDIHLEDWIPKLRKEHRKFDALCDEFLSLYAAGFPNLSPSALKEESLEALDKFLHENFWDKLDPVYGGRFTDIYDDMRSDCYDEAAVPRRRSNRYGYRGVSRRDFMASDRSALIRLASTMPVGTPERKVILAGLEKSAARMDAEVTVWLDDDDDESGGNLTFYVKVPLYSLVAGQTWPGGKVIGDRLESIYGEITSTVNAWAQDITKAARSKYGKVQPREAYTSLEVNGKNLVVKSSWDFDNTLGPIRSILQGVSGKYGFKLI